MAKKCDGNHDHTASGVCLVIEESIGVKTRYNPDSEKQRAELQAAVEENHRKQKKAWLEQAKREHVAPW